MSKRTPAAVEPAEEGPAPVSPLDHDGDGRKGGSAPAPERQHLVILADHGDLRAGEVVSVTPGSAADLLVPDIAREATQAEVDLAQPRIRVLG